MMKGMLWFDNDPKATLADKIHKAMAYYARKYERKAEMCLVNASQFDGDLSETSKEAGLTVKAVRSVMPNHLWIGVEEALPVAGGGE